MNAQTQSMVTTADGTVLAVVDRVFRVPSMADLWLEVLCRPVGTWNLDGEIIIVRVTLRTGYVEGIMTDVRHYKSDLSAHLTLRDCTEVS